MSANCPNVWSKYGGLERLCRDMQNILYHGLIHDQVCRIHFPPPNQLNYLESSCIKLVGREKMKPTGLCEFLSTELRLCVCMHLPFFLSLSSSLPLSSLLSPPLPLHLYPLSLLSRPEHLTSCLICLDVRGRNKQLGRAADGKRLGQFVSCWFCNKDEFTDQLEIYYPSFLRLEFSNKFHWAQTRVSAVRHSSRKCYSFLLSLSFFSFLAVCLEFFGWWPHFLKSSSIVS